MHQSQQSYQTIGLLQVKNVTKFRIHWISGSEVLCSNLWEKFWLLLVNNEWLKTWPRQFGTTRYHWCFNTSCGLGEEEIQTNKHTEAGIGLHITACWTSSQMVFNHTYLLTYLLYFHCTLCSPTMSSRTVFYGRNSIIFLTLDNYFKIIKKIPYCTWILTTSVFFGLLHGHKKLNGSTSIIK